MTVFLATAKDKGLDFGSPNNRARFLEYIRKNPKAKFKIIPQRYESRKMRRYLEGAVVPAYCQWQYEIDPTDTSLRDEARYMFMRDFHYRIINNRKGNPQRVPISSKSEAGPILEKYTNFASENGAPIPNPELFKIWRDKYSMDKRFNTFHDFLEFLNLQCDAMPSRETLKKLD